MCRRNEYGICDLRHSGSIPGGPRRLPGQGREVDGGGDLWTQVVVQVVAGVALQPQLDRRTSRGRSKTSRVATRSPG